MTKPILNLFVNLESEFQNVQKSLTDIDENIRKITGKDPRVFQEKNNRSNRYTGFDNRKSFVGIKRKLYEQDSLDNEEENIYNKRSLQSQVVATSWETKQRNQVLEEQKNDKKSMPRNKRMFGVILGTLEKFKNEESQRKDLQKRAEIENKLDKADEEEREALKKEREILFKERKAKQIQMRCLEQKLHRAQIHKEWEQSQQFVGNYIETKTKPHIFYMPVKHINETLKRQQETRDKYRIILAEKRAKVQKELNEIDELYKKDGIDHDDGNDQQTEHQGDPNDRKNNDQQQDLTKNMDLSKNKVQEPSQTLAAATNNSKVNEKEKTNKETMNNNTGKKSSHHNQITNDSLHHLNANKMDSKQKKSSKKESHESNLDDQQKNSNSKEKKDRADMLDNNNRKVDNLADKEDFEPIYD